MALDFADGLTRCEKVPGERVALGRRAIEELLADPRGQRQVARRGRVLARRCLGHARRGDVKARRGRLRQRPRNPLELNLEVRLRQRANAIARHVEPRPAEEAVADDARAGADRGFRGRDGEMRDVEIVERLPFFDEHRPREGLGAIHRERPRHHIERGRSRDAARLVLRRGQHVLQHGILIGRPEQHARVPSVEHAQGAVRAEDFLAPRRPEPVHRREPVEQIRLMVLGMLLDALLATPQHDAVGRRRLKLVALAEPDRVGAQPRPDPPRASGSAQAAAAQAAGLVALAVGPVFTKRDEAGFDARRELACRGCRVRLGHARPAGIEQRLGIDNRRSR